MLSDLTEEELRSYRSAQEMPSDFDDFWTRTLDEARAVPGRIEARPVNDGVTTVDTWDVRFPGWGGQPIAAWLRRPAGVDSPLPVIVQFIGYGGGRGLSTENLLWASAGFAHLHVDTRGQGSLWSVGDTPDDAGAGPQVPGFLTRGIEDRDTYYYRRVFTDAVRAVDALDRLPGVDPFRVAVIGGSQGGGIALAAAALSDRVSALTAFVPFLCDFPRAVLVHAGAPYSELVGYLGTHRDSVERTLATLSYFDGVNMARRAAVPARFSVALMDEVCKPSTVMGAYREYTGDKELEMWRFNGHEAGGALSEARLIPWLRERLDHDAGASLSPERRA